MRASFLALVAVSVLSLSGCVSQSIKTFQPFQEKNLNALLDAGAYQQKTNSFFVINDSSSSMGDTYLGRSFSNLSKHSVEKELLNRMNKTIPNLNLMSGLRSFGYGPCTGWAYTYLNQALQNYSKTGFDDAIASLECANGGTPVADAIMETQADLSDAQGNIAVIMLSDGYQYADSPASAVTALKQQYGDKLCLHTIWVGNDKEAEGQAVLTELSELSGCSSSTTAEMIASNQGMADFVTKVFLTKAEMRVDNDADKDGVIDSLDKCPNTPIGATVNSQGCWIIKGIHFDTDKSNIKAQYYGILNNVVNVIKRNPGLKIQIQGHTDNRGSAAYNLKLSERRAKSVRDYLSDKTGNQGNLTAKGYGITMPIDSNDTVAGRSNNRRVQLKVLP